MSIDNQSFLLGVFMVNQIVILFLIVETRKAMHELNQSLQRLCTFLSAKKE